MTHWKDNNSQVEQLRKELTKQEIEETGSARVESTVESFYELAAVMVNESDPSMRPHVKECVTVALRALARFFADDMRDNDGVPGHLIDQMLQQADRMGDRFKPNPLTDGRMSYIKTPVAPEQQLVLTDSKGRPMHMSRRKS